MKRREFMTLLSRAVVAAWPLTARAQQTAPLIGFLISGAADSFAIFVDAFRHGMRDHGMIEGRDYVLDLRYWQLWPLSGTCRGTIRAEARRDCCNNHQCSA